MPRAKAQTSRPRVWPGLHRFEGPGAKAKGYGVAWWDPRTLTLNVPQSFGIRQEELLKESDDPQVLKDDLENHESWQTRWDSVKQRAAEPGIIFRTATAQARNESDIGIPYPDVKVVELPRDAERPANAGSVQKLHIRKAGRKLGLGDIGWHTFRHTYRSWLDATGAPLGVQQKLLRHADIRTTMNTYGNALVDSKREANSRVVRMVLGPGLGRAKRKALVESTVN